MLGILVVYFAGFAYGATRLWIWAVLGGATAGCVVFTALAVPRAIYRSKTSGSFVEEEIVLPEDLRPPRRE